MAGGRGHGHVTSKAPGDWRGARRPGGWVTPRGGPGLDYKLSLTGPYMRGGNY